jgi:hypothetical protein
VYVHLVPLTVTGCPAATDGLDGDFARLQQWPRREDGPRSRMRGGLRRPAGVASCLGVRALAATAVGFRTKASGRRLVRAGSPRARRARFLLYAPTLPLRPRARSRAARRAAALGAPLKPVKKVVTGRQGRHEQGRERFTNRRPISYARTGTTQRNSPIWAPTGRDQAYQR